MVGWLCNIEKINCHSINLNWAFCSAAKTPLPPINKTPPPPESAHESIKEVPDETENQFKVTVETLEEDDKEAADTEKEAVNDENGGDAFFMTQVIHHAH